MANPTISAVQLNLNSYKVYDAAQQQDVDMATTASLYTVEGVTNGDGSPRKMSIAELVMVVGLARATEEEAAIIALMEEMSENTNTLNSLTDIEKQLQEKKNLDQITDTYTYQGNEYSAKEFLAIVVGGATPVDPQPDLGLNALWNQISNNHIVGTTGTYQYNGETYTKAYEYIDALGIPDSALGEGNAFYFMSICRYADSLSDDYVFSLNDCINISGEYSILLEPDVSTKADLIQKIDDKYKQDIMNGIMSMAWSYDTNTGGVQTDRPHVLNPASYLPAKIDDLITQIESKMDSLNSFSQQKMIELQSKTNKRDQAYDLITNILKSLNTVEVGIVNNI